MWPAEPGGFVGFPFGRHPKTEGARRFDLYGWLHWEKELNTEVTEDTERKEKREDSESKELTGKGTLFVAEPAVQDGLIGVDAAGAQGGPAQARGFALGGVAVYDEKRVLVAQRLR